ncbi:MAG: murein peptide amidase A [Oligoflexia bacterium]|nr:MAG: murein peptide amidase A [Oligoflexia bacterium]
MGVFLTSFIFTQTTSGLPVIGYQFGKQDPSFPKILILGGVHGDEKEGVVAAHGLYTRFSQNFSYRLNICLVPAFNLDGVLEKTRTNARGVDLNRNLPTKDWSPEIKGPRYNPGPTPNSESENQGLVKYLEQEKPNLIVSLHSWNPVLNVNGDCLKFAEVLAKHTGYKIDADIGYPTPGCLGTYAGLERQSPTLTYEIERGLASDQILKIHVPAICEALKVMES